MALLACQDLSIGYDGREIVRGLNFSVNPGDYLCIVGENGSGKSTLMKTILGLQSPLGGKIITGDGLKPNEIGYLPQQTPVQKDFPASVWEIVLSGCQNGGKRFRPFYSRVQKQIARDTMAQMGVSDLKKRCYRELSGGQQQRVLLARAICAAESVLLLDEPVSGLDPKVTEDMYRLIDHLNRDDGMTVIMISHDIAAVERAGKVLHVGKNIFFGTRGEYLQSAQAKGFMKEAAE
ncbi:MAG: ABC transporter ATP-binding protein [Clostridia bacterium]|nr:ABC transporter ATP-binding protein [Clostridia bacterium]